MPRLDNQQGKDPKDQYGHADAHSYRLDKGHPGWKNLGYRLPVALPVIFWFDPAITITIMFHGLSMNPIDSH